MEFGAWGLANQHHAIYVISINVSNMKKIGIFYGSATGTTQNVSMRIAKMLNIADSDVHDVGKTLPSAVGGYDILVLGTSTWGSGELEDDWFDFLDGIEVLDLRGKEIALFGCGDETMSDTFCSAVGILHDRLSGTGANVYRSV